MIDVIQSPLLSSVPTLSHAFFTRQGGVSEGSYASLNCAILSADNPAHIAQNHMLASAHLGAKAGKLALCRQVRENRVVTVSTLWSNEDRPEADAMVTSCRGLALGILTADCAPVLFVDEVAHVIGAAHAGWQGAITGIVQNTVKEMKNLGAKVERIRAAIGPCIWQDSYEVGPEFQIPFLHQDPSNEQFFKSSAKRGHFMFDLPAYVLAQVKATGITQIEPSMADTCADEVRFYSYRRSRLNGEKETGRLLSALMLKD